MRFFRLYAIVACLLPPALASGELRLGKYPKAYQGQESLVVRVMPLAGEPKQALIQVSGLESVLDGKVLLYDLVQKGGGQAYTMMQADKELTRLRVDRGDWLHRVQLFLPDHRKPFDLWFSEKLTKKIEGEKLLDTYLHRRAPGERATKLNTASLQRKDQQQLDAKKQQAERACSTKLGLTVDWKSISDEQLRLLKIDAYCGHPLDALAKVCQDELGREAVRAKVKQISCRFGKEMKAQLGGGALRWTTSAGGRNQAVYLENFLLNNL